jgi:hypothetical protein
MKPGEGLEQREGPFLGGRVPPLRLVSLFVPVDFLRFAVRPQAHSVRGLFYS